VVMEEIVTVGSAATAPATAPAVRSRYGGRRCVDFSKHAAITIYLSHHLGHYHPPGFQVASQPAIESPHRTHHTVHRHTATRKYPGSDPRSTYQFLVQPALVASAVGRFSFSLQCTTTTTASSTLYSTGNPVPLSVPRPRPAHLATPHPPTYKHSAHSAPFPDLAFRSSLGNIIEPEVSNLSPLLSFALLSSPALLCSAQLKPGSTNIINNPPAPAGERAKYAHYYIVFPPRPSDS
jgi:hypothetical protein